MKLSNFKTAFIFLLFAIVINFPGCQTLDDQFDGEPRYNTDAKKVSGRDLNIFEVATYHGTVNYIKSLDEKKNKNEKNNQAEKRSDDQYTYNSDGTLKGHIVNTSSRPLYVTIWDPNDEVVISITLARYGVAEAFLIPAKNYWYSVNGSRRIKFNVLATAPAPYQIEKRDREHTKEMLLGFFAIDDKIDGKWLEN